MSRDRRLRALETNVSHKGGAESLLLIPEESQVGTGDPPVSIHRDRNGRQHIRIRYPKGAFVDGKAGDDRIAKLIPSSPDRPLHLRLALRAKHCVLLRYIDRDINGQEIDT